MCHPIIGLDETADPQNENTPNIFSNGDMETNSRDVGVGTANTRVSTLSVDISDNDLGISDGYFVKETHFLCLHTTSLYIDFNMCLCLQRRDLRTVPMLGGKQGMHVHANEELK